MKRRTFFATAALFPWLGACAGTGDWLRSIEARGIGMVVEYQLASGASQKTGVNAVADTGYRLFGPSMMTATGGGGTNHLGGTSIPRWVRVTWREGPGIEMDWTNGGWKGGSVVGDYTVPVLERIPPEAFALVKAAPGRALRLSFRIKDDGVSFGWAVQQAGPSSFYDLKRGGDFTDSRMYRLIEQSR